MPPFQLTTPSGTEEDVTIERISEALLAADRSEDPGEFAVVTRDDGVFVQVASGGVLEVGGIGDHPDRLDHALLARDIVERMARHEEPWGGLPHWDIAAARTQRVRPPGRRDRYVALAILVVGLAIAAAILWT